MAKPERVFLSVKTVASLAEAGELIQTRFEADPKLIELYGAQFNQLLDTIERNGTYSAESQKVLK
jgi:hypothetical protein